VLRGRYLNKGSPAYAPDSQTILIGGDDKVLTAYKWILVNVCLYHLRHIRQTLETGGVVFPGWYGPIIRPPFAIEASECSALVLRRRLPRGRSRRGSPLDRRTLLRYL
jgi:hypothetical protein